MALGALQDANHAKVAAAMHELTEERIIPAPVLPELFYLLAKNVNYEQAVKMFIMLQSPAFRIEPLTDVDMQRMTEIMRTYRDNAFDFVDTAIMAQAERLNITRVYTLDHRDFAVYRPAHCAYLTLLP